MSIENISEENERYRAACREQGSPEWLELRLGKVTASRMSDVMSKGVGRQKYMEQLLAERLTGQLAESFSNAAMKWGTEQEPFARQAYEFERECLVGKQPFWEHEEMDVGASPDGLIDNNRDGYYKDNTYGLIEIKCPNSSTHLGWLADKKVPSKHIKQIQCQLWITAAEWCDFVSYDPRIIDREKTMMIVRCERDEVLIKKMEKETIKFLDELDQLCKSLGEK
tara:strand:- start:172 stop:843 length:672 start_codon:yes stop_codon:yes gene_type:complete